MAMPQFTIKDLLEAGAHFGHRTYRWNPKMQEYIYGKRNGVHIIDLQKTVPLFYNALGFLRQTAANGGRILFVGTKRAAQAPVKEAAERCGQYYMNHRWLGGSLTNWKTITRSIKRLRELEKLFAEGNNITETRTKKERLMLEREFSKLSRSLSGVESMGGLPAAIIVTDVVKDKLAIEEARCLGIPVIGILDTNSSPEGVDFPIPANDDAARALRLYTRLMADAVLDGISTQVAKVEKRVVSNKSANKDAGKVKLSAAAKKVAEEEKEAKVEVVKKAAPKKVAPKAE